MESPESNTNPSVKPTHNKWNAVQAFNLRQVTVFSFLCIKIEALNSYAY